MVDSDVKKIDTSEGTWVVVVGSGPAGLTAAIYLARSNTHVLVIDGPTPGGQLTTTTDVDNFPGFPGGITGPELMSRMREQASRLGVHFSSETVVGARLSRFPIELDLSDEMGEQRTIVAQAVVVSSGATAKLLGIENESSLMGAGVSACATCDGFFYQDKDVAVVGGGDTAMEEAMFLTRFARSVTLVHRRDGFSASPAMLERAQKNPKITWKLFKVVEQIHGSVQEGLQRVTLRDPRDNALSELEVDGLFIAIGHTPNTGPFSEQLACDEQGYILTVDRSTATSMRGVFACGDVSDPHYRQAITAAGTGCMAALDAYNYLASLS